MNPERVNASGHLRNNIKTILQIAMREQGMTYTELMAATGLDLRIVGNATSYGLAELGDFIAICRALDLDASAVLAEAENHIASGTIGTDLHIERHEITHWRDLSEQQLDDLNNKLAHKH